MAEQERTNIPSLDLEEPRQLVLHAMIGTVLERRSGNQLLTLFELDNKQQQAFARALYMQCLRFYPALSRLVDSCLKKPLKSKDLDIYLVLVIGVCQLRNLAVADHAAISETVQLCRVLGKDWACGLVNGILRRVQRDGDKLTEKLASDEVFSSAHPAWLIKKLKQSWPQQWQQIIEQNNIQPPLTLRVNTQQVSRETYQQQLAGQGFEATAHPFAKDALLLERALDISQLPGFAQGLFAVQDAAAQLAVEFLRADNDHRVLDACAAPGGKTTHILQTAPHAKVTALDLSADRLQKVSQNLQRLGFDAELVSADLLNTDSWWDGRQYDRILLDAPCSATGVIRRNPDIKIHRRQRDINKLAKLQSEMLDCCWQLLKPGGVLVYATCSVLPAENLLQIESFCQRTQALPLAVPESFSSLVKNGGPGLQILPGEASMDGFFLCAIEKTK